ncbi:hypothetical protein [Echinimonas agarilytica]|uniref:Uncharacterized protein n=1 Tax=Echinimonas agarilytica TaxID=1215918 RepID=A0AA41W6D5_9GAMM|nr:hypothetical protein [Echinimonas agarilytica]MCM2679394.1 hypothetical protein [Echinimonas agarilytica]
MSENYFNWRQEVKDKTRHVTDHSSVVHQMNDKLLQDQYFKQHMSSEEAAQAFLKAVGDFK